MELDLSPILRTFSGGSEGDQASGSGKEGYLAVDTMKRMRFYLFNSVLPGHIYTFIFRTKLSAMLGISGAPRNNERLSVA